MLTTSIVNVTYIYTALLPLPENSVDILVWSKLLLTVDLPVFVWPNRCSFTTDKGAISTFDCDSTYVWFKMGRNRVHTVHDHSFKNRRRRRRRRRRHRCKMEKRARFRFNMSLFFGYLFGVRRDL